MCDDALDPVYTFFEHGLAMLAFLVADGSRTVPEDTLSFSASCQDLLQSSLSISKAVSIH